MASSRRHPTRCLSTPPCVLTTNRYFLITITNFPYFLTRSAPYHEADLEHTLALDDPNDPNAREAILYNTLKHQFEQALRSYFEQTEKRYPMTIVFDMRDMSLPH